MIKALLGSLGRAVRTYFTVESPPEPDLGPGAPGSAVLWTRFSQCRKRDVVWRQATLEEGQAHRSHPVVDRFGDWTVAVAEVEGRAWLVRERIWSGFPDPPRYVLFVLEEDRVWAAGDFEGWPRRWTQPPEAAAAQPGS